MSAEQRTLFGTEAEVEAEGEPEATTSPEPGFYKPGEPDPDQLHLVDADGPYWTEILEEEQAQGDRGLSLLVDLVKMGTVDPWDIDLEVVADRFMEAVDALGVEDLPKSGRLLFFASVLIRMKAQYLAGRTQDLLAPPPEEMEDWGEDGPIEWGDLEGDDENLPISRRGPGEILLFPRQRIRKRRPITIQDLLEALESSEAHERKMSRQREKRAKKRVVPFKSVKEAMAVLHQDDLTKDIGAASRLVRMAFESMESIPLDDLGRELDRVSGFLAALFLAARGEVDLEQDSFYGPIRLTRPPEGREATKIVPRERFVPVKRKTKAEREAEKILETQEKILAMEELVNAGELDPEAKELLELREALTKLEEEARLRAEAAAQAKAKEPPAEAPADPIAAAALQALVGLRKVPETEPEGGADGDVSGADESTNIDDAPIVEEELAG